MSGYSDNREQNMEIKYLYKIWSQVDRNVQLPPTLTGNALLPKISGIHHPAPVNRKIRFSPRIFTWQSGVSYAAAFVLIVLLSTFLRRNTGNPDIIMGTIPAVEAETTISVAQDEGNGEAQSSMAMQQPIPEAVQYNVADTVDEAALDTPKADTELPALATVPGSLSPAAAISPEENDTMAGGEGVGGPGESMLLGVEGDYTFTYRPNDSTDPDKGEFPITVSVMDTVTKELAYMIDIPDMLKVEKFFVYDGKLAMVGPSHSGVTLRAYDISQVGEAVEQLVSAIPGLYLDANLYKNVVHVVTFVDGEQQLEAEVIPLPGSTETTRVVFTALDVETLSLAQKAFAGANTDISLHNLNAYLKYPGQITEENETSQYVAQIRLDGMGIELGNPQSE